MWGWSKNGYSLVCAMQHFPPTATRLTLLLEFQHYCFQLSSSSTSFSPWFSVRVGEGMALTEAHVPSLRLKTRARLGVSMYVLEVGAKIWNISGDGRESEKTRWDIWSICPSSSGEVLWRLLTLQPRNELLFLYKTRVQRTVKMWRLMWFTIEI